MIIYPCQFHNEYAHLGLRKYMPFIYNSRIYEFLKRLYTGAFGACVQPFKIILSRGKVPEHPPQISNCPSLSPTVETVIC